MSWKVENKAIPVFKQSLMKEVAEYIQDCLLEIAELYNTGEPICDFDNRYIKLRYTTNLSKDLLASIQVSHKVQVRLFIKSVTLFVAHANDDSLYLEYVYKP